MSPVRLSACRRCSRRTFSCGSRLFTFQRARREGRASVPRHRSVTRSRGRGKCNPPRWAVKPGESEKLKSCPQDLKSRRERLSGSHGFVAQTFRLTRGGLSGPSHAQGPDGGRFAGFFPPSTVHPANAGGEGSARGRHGCSRGHHIVEHDYGLSRDGPDTPRLHRLCDVGPARTPGHIQLRGAVAAAQGPDDRDPRRAAHRSCQHQRVINPPEEPPAKGRWYGHDHREPRVRAFGREACAQCSTQFEPHVAPGPAPAGELQVVDRVPKNAVVLAQANESVPCHAKAAARRARRPAEGRRGFGLVRSDGGSAPSAVRRGSVGSPARLRGTGRERSSHNAEPCALKVGQELADFRGPRQSARFRTIARGLVFNLFRGWPKPRDPGGPVSGRARRFGRRRTRRPFETPKHTGRCPMPVRAAGPLDVVSLVHQRTGSWVHGLRERAHRAAATVPGRVGPPCPPGTLWP